MMAAIFVLTFVDRSFGPILPLYLGPRRPRRRAGRCCSPACCSRSAAAGAAVGNQACEWLLREPMRRRVIAGGSRRGGRGRCCGSSSASNDVVMGCRAAGCLGVGAGVGDHGGLHRRRARRAGRVARHGIRIPDGRVARGPRAQPGAGRPAQPGQPAVRSSPWTWCCSPASSVRRPSRRSAEPRVRESRVPGV